jgi:hypothetical protein
LAKLANKETRTVVNALLEQAKMLPSELYKSLAWGRDKELADHQASCWPRISRFTSVIRNPHGSVIQ